MDLHPVFETEVMKNISNFTLSTSTLNSDAVSLGAFGPVGTVNPETGKPVSLKCSKNVKLTRSDYHFRTDTALDIVYLKTGWVYRYLDMLKMDMMSISIKNLLIQLGIF